MEKEIDLEVCINKIVNLFTDKDKLLKIKNSCFKQENIKKLEEKIKEKEKELKEFEFIGHDKKDESYGKIRDTIQTNITEIDNLLSKLYSENEIKVKKYFEVDPCCKIYEEIENLLLKIRKTILFIKDKVKIEKIKKKNEENEKSEVLYSYGLQTGITKELANELKSNTSYVIKKVTKDIDKAFSMFIEEQKTRKTLHEKKKEEKERQIERFEDKLFEIKKNVESSVYNELKLEIHNLTLDLLIVEQKEKIKSKIDDINGGVSILIGCLGGAVIGGIIGGIGGGLKYGTAAGGLKGAGVGLVVGGIIGGVYGGIKHYYKSKEIEEKNKQIEKENNKKIAKLKKYEKEIIKKIKSIEIKTSESIDEEIIIIKEMLKKLQNSYNKCNNNNINLNDYEDINNRKKKLNAALEKFKKKFGV